MSIPPDDLCICALTTKAYPEFTDEQVTNICGGHWDAIKATMACTQVHLQPATEEGFEW